MYAAAGVVLFFSKHDEHPALSPNFEAAEVEESCPVIPATYLAAK